MNNIDELMENIEQFQNNIKNMSLLLDSIKKIHDDYEETIDIPRKLISKINETNDKQIKEFEQILLEEKKLVNIIKEYDKTIENCVNETVNKNLHNINVTNRSILEEIENKIHDYELCVSRYEELSNQFNIDIDKRFNQFILNMEEYDKKLQNSLIKINALDFEQITIKMNKFEGKLRGLRTNNNKISIFQVINILITILTAILIILIK